MNSMLSRFHDAQKNTYNTALSEIRSGRKTSHWMWFIFPQLRALGRSDTARYYGIADLQEAADYMADPILGGRLIEISQALLTLETDDPRAVFGSPDDLKLRSCMTLFHRAAPSVPVFSQVLQKYYGGRPDKATLSLLERSE